LGNCFGFFLALPTKPKRLYKLEARKLLDVLQTLNNAVFSTVVDPDDTGMNFCTLAGGFAVGRKGDPRRNIQTIH
jgi:hypothetical protein